MPGWGGDAGFAPTGGSSGADTGGDGWGPELLAVHGRAPGFSVFVAERKCCCGGEGRQPGRRNGTATYGRE